MDQDDDPLLYALRPRRHQVLLAEYFEHAGPREPGEGGPQVGGQGDGRENQMREAAPPGGGEPPEIDGDHHDEHDPHPEEGRGLSDDGQGHGGHVGEPSAANRRKDAEGQRHDHGQRQRGQREFVGGRQPFQHQGQRRLLVAKADAKVAVDGPEQESDVLEIEGLVETQRVPQAASSSTEASPGSIVAAGSPDRRSATKASVTTPSATNAVWSSFCAR